MNVLTRLFVLSFVLCYLFNVLLDFRFLWIGIVLIIVAYYAVRVFSPTASCKEHYGLVDTVMEPVPPVPWNTGTNDFVFSSGQDDARNRCDTPPATSASFTLPRYVHNPQLVDTGQTSAWCPTNRPLEETISMNQTLVGPPNPKTLVQPVIPSPIYDFETWKPNDFIIPSGINDQRRQELFDNGYVPISRVASVPTEHSRIPIESIESYESSGDAANPYQRFSYPSIDRACGYNPTNLDYNLPINYQANACQKTDLMKAYNDRLFSIPLQPGLYTKSQVNQTDASQSNLGISSMPSFYPTTFEKQQGVNMFVERAQPLPPTYAPFPQTSEPLRTEIYDPRLTGYGTSYRTYIEPVTGQPRFYYDDINQQTQYNYITRNNVDFAGFGTSVGPVRGSLEGDALTRYADQTYSESQMSFRNEMQQRLMHKNSNREWQQRIAPISTMNHARAGGGKMNTGGSYAGPRG